MAASTKAEGLGERENYRNDKGWVVSPSEIKATRGSGLLENFLCRLRCWKANQLIGSEYRGGTVVDIGCGSYPYFLMKATTFKTRHGVDRVLSPEVCSHCERTGVLLHSHDIEARAPLPFENGAIDVVTMLAVYEHLDSVEKHFVLSEAFRVLRPGGLMVLTTPAWWTAPILSFLGWIGFVSHEEIEEHRDLSRPSEIRGDLERSGFSSRAIDLGTFELGLNQWARARR